MSRKKVYEYFTKPTNDILFLGISISPICIRNFRS